ncbi:hypothetical protein QVD17_01636 [Tagetes erecta]|uniref:Uncharacterized protein n=1 Tax=Tagetes erecta TaxID=13708 RepID=A0AAD8L7U4_TARER|nr:hypothetical protein QVD17_01636 [Tagetes erecta]
MVTKLTTSYCNFIIQTSITKEEQVLGPFLEKSLQILRNTPSQVYNTSKLFQSLFLTKTRFCLKVCQTTR